MYRSSPEFTKHSQNLAAVRKSLTQVERGHKQAIRGGDPVALQTSQRLHLLLIGVLAEATLRKIVTDPNGLNSREQAVIWNARSQLDRWLAVVDLATRRHYGVLLHQEIDVTTVSSTAFERYEELQSLLSQDLAPVIEDRNKIAHGQWVWQLKSRKENEFKADQAPTLPNYLTLKSQSDLIVLISELVYVLAVSEKTFDRDYTELGARLAQARQGLDGAAYSDFVSALKARKPRN